MCQLVTDGDAAALSRALHRLAEDDAVHGALVLACDANAATPEAWAELDAVVRASPVPVHGGVFPAILHESGLRHTGYLVLGLVREVHAHVVPGLGDPEADFEALLSRSMAGKPYPGLMLVLVDGLSRRIAAFIEALFRVRGLEADCLGGGAGSLSLQRRPCIITPQGLLSDAALVLELDVRAGVGVSHGWRPLEELASCSGLEPCKATEVKDTVLHSLNWRPAFEVYREAVRRHAGVDIDPDAFFEVAKAYPFGIARLDGERIVRDPLFQEDGRLVCVGEIPPGAFLDVLHGDAASLVEAAAAALKLARRRLPEAVTSPVSLVMDCISRVLFLGDAFDRELDALRAPGVPLMGACTIGEIAASGRSRLDFHNKTCVVGLLESP